MSIPRDRRTTKERPCPACLHPQRGRYGHCFFLQGGEAVWCANVSNFAGHRGVPRKGGFVHRLVERTDERAVYRPVPTKPVPVKVKRDFAGAASAFAKAVTPEMARAIADELGLNVTSLRRLGMGWATAAKLWAMGTKCSADGCWTFPMRDGATGAVVGIRLRTPDGFKYAVDASDGDGLFIPTALQHGGQLVLPEGPTSCAAMEVLRFAAAGRPNNRAGVGNVLALVRRLRPARVVVLGDNDRRFNQKLGRWEWPGWEGASAVAGELARRGVDARAVVPPETVKDARAWLQSGADAPEVQAWIERCWREGWRERRHAG